MATKPNYLKWVNSRPTVKSKARKVKELETKLQRAKSDKKKALEAARKQYKKKYSTTTATKRRRR